MRTSPGSQGRQSSGGFKSTRTAGPLAGPTDRSRRGGRPPPDDEEEEDEERREGRGLLQMGMDSVMA
jgi:hypothetical protein